MTNEEMMRQLYERMAAEQQKYKAWLLEQPPNVILDNACKFTVREDIVMEMEVLELACGSGQFSFRLAERVRQWTATDFSEKMVLEAQKRSGPQSLTFEVQDATNLPYPAESFDAVLIANALHIMPSPDKALEEIHRVLIPGGMLLAPTFLWKTGIRQQLGTRLMELAGFRVYHKWNAQEFQSYVEARGFTALEQRVLDGGVRPLCCLIARKK